MTYKEFKLRMQVLQDVQEDIQEIIPSKTISNKDLGLALASDLVQRQKNNLFSKLPREFVNVYAKERVLR